MGVEKIKSTINMFSNQEIIGSMPWFDMSEILYRQFPRREPTFKSLSDDAFSEKVRNLRLKGEKIMREETNAFEKVTQPHTTASRSRWLFHTKNSGTNADKIAAAIILVKASPMTNLHTLDMLLDVIRSGLSHSNKLISKTLRAIEELFINVLLPNRKLHYLEHYIIDMNSEIESYESEQLLLYLYFEECIKRRYSDFITTLEKLTLHKFKYVKEISIYVLLNFLTKKSEKENIVLNIIVNKFGDNDKKIVSQTINKILLFLKVLKYLFNWIIYLQFCYF